MKRLIILAAMTFCTACNGILLPYNEFVDIDGNSVSHDMIVLGDHLEDPYSVENMTKAFESLYPTKAARGTVTTTDYYVRFLPENEDQFLQLEKLGVVMLDHPVDFEIIKEGDYYHDPSIDDDKITWQYAVVSKDFSFPEGIRYEKLEECCLPENAATKAEWADWSAVERKAFIISGNEAMLQPETKAGGRPVGRVTISDSRKCEEIGVKGVTVSCNVFVKFAHAFTDDEGNYRMEKSFASEPRYRLLFKNKKGFGIGFNLLLVPASFSTLGKGETTGIDIRIDENSERKLFSRCVVNNAAYDYWAKCNTDEGSMRTPPTNLRIWLFQKMGISAPVMLQQGAIVDDSILSRYLGEYVFLLKMFLPDLTLGLKDLDSYDKIYGATVHQMAHASHYMQAGEAYWNEYLRNLLFSFVTSGFVTYGVGTEENHGYCEVSEMWAYYIQTKMMRDRYPGNELYGDSYWFDPQIFLKLDGKGINRYRIFSALTEDVTDIDLLQKKMISLYPESKSIINQAFGKYN